MNNEWMNDPSLSNIDKHKLDFLQMLVFESQSLSKEQMLPYLLSVAKKRVDNHIEFSPEEIALIVDVIKRYAPSEDIGKIDKLLYLWKKNE